MAREPASDTRSSPEAAQGTRHRPPCAAATLTRGRCCPGRGRGAHPPQVPVETMTTHGPRSRHRQLGRILPGPPTRQALPEPSLPWKGCFILGHMDPPLDTRGTWSSSRAFARHLPRRHVSSLLLGSCAQGGGSAREAWQCPPPAVLTRDAHPPAAAPAVSKEKRRVSPEIPRVRDPRKPGGPPVNLP